MKTNMTRLLISMPKDQHRQLRIAAAHRGESMSKMVNNALRAAGMVDKPTAAKA